MSAAVRSLPERSALPFDPKMPPADRVRTLVAALPDALQEVLASGRVERCSRFRDEVFDDLAELWLPPASVNARTAAIAQRTLDEMERSVLAPADTNHVLARVLSLLSHFPAKALPAPVEEMVALDWADDLGEFPGWAIDQAARVWRRTRKWKPSIAEMRALCEEACAPERRVAARLKAVAQAGTADPAVRPESLLRLAGVAVRRMS
ncbi:hypothetical protein [Azospirillum oleiclasticum]|uniref:hypothetical protein n=1 Tax=Azospirillum oleiclasticum TaxID=2735135 RepID=UPI0015D4C8D5|nr:hypothetical protein [Azospirillum oleiclasticum]